MKSRDNTAPVPEKGTVFTGAGRGTAKFTWGLPMSCLITNWLFYHCRFLPPWQRHKKDMTMTKSRQWHHCGSKWPRQCQLHHLGLGMFYFQFINSLYITNWLFYCCRFLPPWQRHENDKEKHDKDRKSRWCTTYSDDEGRRWWGPAQTMPVALSGH